MLGESGGGGGGSGAVANNDGSGEEAVTGPGSQETPFLLPEVTISPNPYGYLNLWQAAALDIGRDDAKRKQVDDFENVLLGSMAVGAAPLVVASAPSLFVVSAELAAEKALLSWSAQALINGVREVDYADVVGDAFTAPGLNAMLGGGVDFKPLSTSGNVFRIQGIYNSKPLGQFATDATLGFGFGKIGDLSWKPLTPFLRTSFERTALYFPTQIPISTGQEGAGKIVGN